MTDLAWWGYPAILVASFLVDIIPFIGPPAWTVMVLFQTLGELNVWIVLPIGVAGSMLGRWALAHFIVPRLSDRYVKLQKNEDMQFVGRRLEEQGLRSALFVFVYTLLPLPTTPLFTAAGMARVSLARILPIFFVGKLISDTIMVATGKHVLSDARNLADGLVSTESIVGLIIAAFLMAGLLFVDWRALLEHGTLRFRFNIWKERRGR